MSSSDCEIEMDVFASSVADDEVDEESPLIESESETSDSGIQRGAAVVEEIRKTVLKVEIDFTHFVAKIRGALVYLRTCPHRFREFMVNMLNVLLFATRDAGCMFFSWLWLRLYVISFTMIFSTALGPMQFTVLCCKRWILLANVYYIVLISGVIELFTGLISTVVVDTLVIISTLLKYASFRVTLALMTISLLFTSKVFCIWLVSVIRVNTWKKIDYKLNGICRVIKNTYSSDEPSISHPNSSRLRNLGMQACKDIAAFLSLRPYFINKSRRVHQSGAYGSTFSFDLDVDVNDPYVAGEYSDEPGTDDLICMVDRDYYYDMNEVLLLAKPMCIYTFDPLEPCATTEEYKYRFDIDGRVVGSVKGGGNWSHYLWDYPDDILTISKYGVCVSYKILRFTFDDSDHELSTRSMLFLIPAGIRFGFTEKLMGRKNPVKGKTVIMYDHDADGSDVLLAPLGSYKCYSVSNGNWEMMLAEVIARSTRPGVVKVSLPAIQEIMLMLGYDMKLPAFKELAKVLFQCLSTLDYDKPYDFGSTPYSIVINFKQDVEDAISDMDSYEEDPHDPAPTAMFIDDNGNGKKDNPKPGMVLLGEPLSANIAVPDKSSPQNVKTCIETRKWLCQAEMMDYIKGDDCKDLLSYIGEFNDLLLRGAQLSPFSEEQVSERMNRPSQQSDLRESSTHFVENVEKPELFLKSEPLSSDPRPITTEKGIHKWRFAAYVYAMTEIFKKTDWYAFGKSPPDVAARIARVCSKIRENWELIETDYSRFDGHMSPIIRYAIFKLYTTAYSWNDDYRQDIEDLLSERYFRATIADTDDEIIKFLSCWEQSSGDQNTSNVGTYTNALVAYTTLRKSGLTSPEAWDELGQYGGDDGVTTLPPDVDIVKIASRYGFKITSDPKNRGDHVKFLSRIYSPEVWNGDVNNCADIGRQIDKLMITENKGVPRAMKLYQKCFSHALNDAQTPVLGEFCVAVVIRAERLGYRSTFTDLKGKSEEESPESIYAISKDHLSHWGTIALAYEAGFPNDNTGQWMDAYFAQSRPSFDLRSFEVRLTAAKEISDKRIVERAVDVKLSCERKLSKKDARALLDYILEPFTKVGNHDKEEVTDFKTGTHLIINDGHEEKEIIVPGPNRTPLELTRPDVGSVGAVKEYGIYDRILRHEIPVPFPELTPGARKCLYLVCQFVEFIKTHYPKNHRSSHFVYTGAAGNDIAQALKVIRELKPAKIHLYDPSFGIPANDLAIKKVIGESKDVVLRATRFNESEVKKIIDRATKKDNGYVFPIFWLDDAFSGDAKIDAKLLVEKYLWLEKFGSNCKAVSLKIKGTTQVTTCVKGLKLLHTPTRSEYFTDVKEFRAIGIPTVIPGDVTDTNFMEADFVTVTEREALVTLYRHI